MRAFASWPSLHLICVHAWAPQVKVHTKVDPTKMIGVIEMVDVMGMVDVIEM